MYSSIARTKSAVSLWALWVELLASSQEGQPFYLLSSNNNNNDITIIIIIIVKILAFTMLQALL